MHTLEALIAVMLILGIIGVVMQVYTSSVKVLDNSTLLKKMDEEKNSTIRDSKLSFGDGRDNKTKMYSRWYF